METNKRILWINLAVLLLPAIYLAYVWNQLPQQVPMHYDIHGNVDRYGDKSEMILVNAILLFVGLGTSLLVIYLPKIDPKKASTANQNVLGKIAFVTAFFMALLQLYFIFITLHQDLNSPKPVLVAVSLLFTLLGNFMNNVKPNYFVGIRTPWTLENEDVWRRTHHLGAKLWFWGGLFCALVVLLSPIEFGMIFFIVTIVIISLIPIVQSYRLFRKLQKQ